MTASTVPPDVAAAPRDTALRRHLRALAATGTAALALSGWLAVELHQVGELQPIDFEWLLRSRASILASLAVVLAPLLVRADAAVDRGAPPARTYARAALIATGLGTLAQFALHRMLGAEPAAAGATAGEVPPIQLARVYLEYVLWVSAYVYAHAGLRGQSRAAARLASAALARARLQRRATEARLLALQARVEPQLLFDTLAAVRARYATDAAQAGRLIDALAAYLRAALPAEQDGGTTIGQELERVRARLALTGASGRSVVLRVHVDPALMRRRCPPLVLLPAVEALLRTAPQADAVDVSVEGHRGALEVALHVPGACAAAAGPALVAVGERLQSLYGASAALAIGAAGGTEVAPGPRTRDERIAWTLPDEEVA